MIDFRRLGRLAQIYLFSISRFCESSDVIILSFQGLELSSHNQVMGMTKDCFFIVTVLCLMHHLSRHSYGATIAISKLI